MDNLAKQILQNYILEKYNIDINTRPYIIYITWKCKAIQNYKYLLYTNLPDNKYYELTYNGDVQEWYLDVYSKIDKQIITNDSLN